MDNFREFLRNRRNLIAVGILVFLALSLPFLLLILKQTQVFRSNASGELIQIGDGPCIQMVNGKKAAICETIPLKLTHPFGALPSLAPTASAAASPSPTTSKAPSPSPSATASVGTAQTIRVSGNTDVEIQAALNQLKTTGGAVYLPAGTYTINKKVKVYSNITLFGDGVDLTILNGTPSIQATDETKETPVLSNDSNAGQKNITIRDMTVHGDWDSAARVIKIENLDGGFIYNVKMENSKYGLLLGFHDGKGTNNVRVSNCSVSSVRSQGIFISLGENNVIDHCSVSGADPVNIGLEIGAEGKISNNLIVSNSTSGGGHAYSATAGNDTQYDPSWINSNNVFCYNSASGGTIPKFWDQRGTNNVYVGNSIGVENVGSFGYEEKGGTDPRCDIPASMSIPAVPTKPAAMAPVEHNWLSWLPDFNVAAAAISASITAAPNPCILNGSDKCSSKITWSSSGAPNLKISIREAPGSVFAQGASGSQDAPWISTSGATFDAYNGTTLLATVKVTAVQSSSSASQAPAASPIGSASASASQPPSGPSSYRLAETQEQLAQAQWVSYTSSPIITNFTISKEPGPKQIWVEFKNAAGQSITDHLSSFDLLAPAPTVSGVGCTLDLTSKNLKVTVTGTNLGSQNGTLTANTSSLDVVSWSDTSVVGILKTAASTGQKYTITLKRPDTQQSLPQSCQVNTSAVSLGARVFCRAEGQFDVSNVKISFAPLSTPDQKVEEIATIDKDGIAQGLKTKLQSGQQYLVSIDAPYSLKRNAVITVQDGTTVLNAPDGKPFILPVGDIAPTTPDGEINALDRAELVKQWRNLTSSSSATISSTLTGDFNRDKKVNSVDWACMKYDFNTKDDDPTSTGSTYNRGINFSNGQNSVIFTGQ